MACNQDSMHLKSDTDLTKAQGSYTELKTSFQNPLSLEFTFNLKLFSLEMLRDKDSATVLF